MTGSHTRKPFARPSTIARRALYERRKAELIRLVGDRCAHCGRKSKLTFDHIDGHRDWEPREVHGTKRLRIYLEEARAGLIQPLCIHCNSSKSDSPEEDENF